MSTAAGTKTTALPRSPRRLRRSTTAAAFGQVGRAAVRIDHFAGACRHRPPSKASEPAERDGRQLGANGDGDLCTPHERATDFDGARQLAVVRLEHIYGGAVGVAVRARVVGGLDEGAGGLVGCRADGDLGGNGRPETDDE